MKESPWLAFAGVFALCLFGLCWNSWRRDPEPTPWNLSDVPPTQASMVVTVPGQLQPGTSPMSIGGPFRHRRYADQIASISASFIGGN